MDDSDQDHFNYDNAFASPLKAEKIGLILGSFGDVDSKEEIEEFVKNTLKDPDILPLPKPLRQIIANGGWHIDKKNVYKRYESFAWKTAFRENSRYQAKFIARKLKERGYDASAYIGFSMTSPYVHEAVDKAYNDGVGDTYPKSSRSSAFKSDFRNSF